MRVCLSDVPEQHAVTISAAAQFEVLSVLLKGSEEPRGTSRQTVCSRSPICRSSRPGGAPPQRRRPPTGLTQPVSELTEPVWESSTAVPSEDNQG